MEQKNRLRSNSLPGSHLPNSYWKREKRTSPECGSDGIKNHGGTGEPNQVRINSMTMNSQRAAGQNHAAQGERPSKRSSPVARKEFKNENWRREKSGPAAPFPRRAPDMRGKLSLSRAPRHRTSSCKTLVTISIARQLQTTQRTAPLVTPRLLPSREKPHRNRLGVRYRTQSMAVNEGRLSFPPSLE